MSEDTTTRSSTRSDHVVSTPTVRQLSRRAAFWTSAALFVAATTVVLVILGSGATDGVALDPGSSAPGGAGAVVEVLRDNGVEVDETLSLSETRRSLDAETTLLLFDPSGFLSPSQLDSLAQSTRRAVLVAPALDELDAFAPSITFAGSPLDEGVVRAGCDAVPAAESAGAIPIGGTSYRVDDASASACFPTGDDAYSLVRVVDETRTVTVLGDDAVLANETIAVGGRAALALGLLGEGHRLVWYLPTAADVEANGPPNLGALTPPWVTPVLILLVITTIAAALWRGRRLGPLIVESLPVVVRASETAEGRARLYASSSTRLRALDALRIGTVRRLSARLALPAHASIDEVARTVSAVLAAAPSARETRDDKSPRRASDPGSVHALIVGAVPGNDAELIALSDALLRLERDVATALGDESREG